MWKRKEQYIQCMVTMTIIWAAGPSMSLQGYSLPVNSPIGTQLRQAKLNLVPPNESQGQGFGASSKPQPNKKSSNPPAGEFELQELRAQLDAMARQNIKLENLTPMKRIELESYVKAVVGNKVSPIPLRDMASPFNLPKLLGTWRLGFSTEDVTLNALPPGATVFVKIKELPEGKKDGTLDYILKFQQGAMKELRAKSTFTLDVSLQYLLDCLGCNAFIIFCELLAWSHQPRIIDLRLSGYHFRFVWHEYTCRLVWNA